MTMMIMMIIITFCALDILKLEFLTCKWQLVWNMLIKIIIIIIIIVIIRTFKNCVNSKSFDYITGRHGSTRATRTKGIVS